MSASAGTRSKWNFIDTQPSKQILRSLAGTAACIGRERNTHYMYKINGYIYTVTLIRISIMDDYCYDYMINCFIMRYVYTRIILNCIVYPDLYMYTYNDYSYFFGLL